MIPNLLVLGSAIVPLLLALAVVLGLRRWRARDGRTLPISAKLIHGPGEQLRQKIGEVEDSLGSGVAAILFVGPAMLASWAISRLDLAHARLGFSGWVFLVVGAAFLIYQIRSIVQLGIDRRHLLEGLIAEQFTAQELNHLAGYGCLIFHDVPADGFNIDHVVIGPAAVYAIETKSRRKPKQDPAGGHYKVAFDGKGLRFPDHASKDPVDQARRQAGWLAKEIQKVTSKAVPVVGALSLPGWWIDYGKGSSGADVKVFNPAGKGAKFMAERGPMLLDEPTRSLVAQCISMRYPDLPASLSFSS